MLVPLNALALTELLEMNVVPINAFARIVPPNAADPVRLIDAPSNEPPRTVPEMYALPVS